MPLTLLSFDLSGQCSWSQCCKSLSLICHSILREEENSKRNQRRGVKHTHTEFGKWSKSLDHNCLARSNNKNMKPSPPLPTAPSFCKKYFQSFSAKTSEHGNEFDIDQIRTSCCDTRELNRWVLLLYYFSFPPPTHTTYLIICLRFMCSIRLQSGGSVRAKERKKEERKRWSERDLDFSLFSPRFKVYSGDGLVSAAQGKWIPTNENERMKRTDILLKECVEN